MTAEISTSLNHLAGVSGFDAQGAANIYAGTTNETLVGALNRRAGNTLPNYFDLDGVCNQLAGTSGFAGVAALDHLAFGPADLGETWAHIQGTWANQLETWRNV